MGVLKGWSLTTSPSRSPPPVFEGIGRSPGQYSLSVYMTKQGNEVIPFIEKTTAFGNGSFSKGDPGGGFPMAVTICTSPGCITGDLCRLR